MFLSGPGKTDGRIKRTAAAAFVLTMITAGCAEKERYAERYLDSVNLTIHMDRAAEVSGFLRRGTSPGSAMEYPDLTGASRISFDCSPEDSARLAGLLQTTDVPFSVSSRDEDLPPCVRFWQDGITWRPVYSWTVEGDSCRFAARVALSNSTGREWFSQNTIMKDMEDNPVCMVQDTLLIRNGDMELGWWRAGGRVQPLTIVYGWPQDSRWNQLVPCLVPNAGRLTVAEWPRRTGDTLWVPPETPLELMEEVRPNSGGYRCSLVLHNQTGEYVELRLVHPERTPRGAFFNTGEDFPSFLGLHPGDLVVLDYDIVYR
ncbi:MAG: hypothetical protein JXA64_03875 [Candidatus Fermentibacteraceae bacterium]|nr:hypothetical protein [Candidatus Fermentibacteraceae bacterium]MBN2608230.1 hypothetical protein [Candidatus Fermentibacteraceae bacterium]